MTYSRFSFLLIGGALLFDSLTACAQPRAEYVADKPVSGFIRIWGHGSLNENYLASLMSAWELGLHQFQPNIRFQTTLRGNSTAIGGLYTGAADVALIERRPISIELDAYQAIFKQDPFEIVVATGSLDVQNHNPALVVFVHSNNPLKSLTLAQLDAIISADHRRSTKPIHTWGELGLTGAWKNKTIKVYIPAISSMESQFLEQTVMGGSQKWTANLREFNAVPRHSDPGRKILDALAKDQYAIAVSTMVNKNVQVKPLSLAINENSPNIYPSRESVAQRSYPLTRSISIFINHTQGQTITQPLKEYLRYILSAQGQADIERDGMYFPLNPEILAQERSKLN
ncbi:PstS family phosphate ABC transporter substrate-binding protein [Undibacterium sp. Ji50W]|uniref:PstS family phosphate ABC transporter substrate-binding protein n=1 Tax=Undibacterium sp. Ji50W TaxID=3413041 RepID=UPI003BF11B23